MRLNDAFICDLRDFSNRDFSNLVICFCDFFFCDFAVLLVICFCDLLHYLRFMGLVLEVTFLLRCAMFYVHF